MVVVLVIKMTKCCYCGKEIGVGVPDRHIEVYSCSCNDCVPEHSSARNGIDESLYTEHPIAYRLRKAREHLATFKAQKEQ